jgi:hypothetical protein
VEEEYNYCVRFQVLTAVSMKFRVVWDLAPCSLHVDRVSKMRTASIIRAMNKPRAKG